MKDLDYIKKGQGVSEGFTKILRHKSGPIFQQLGMLSNTHGIMQSKLQLFALEAIHLFIHLQKTYLSIDSLNQVFSDLSNYNYAGRNLLLRLWRAIYSS